MVRGVGILMYCSHPLPVQELPKASATMQATWKRGCLSNPWVQLTCIATLVLLSKLLELLESFKRAAPAL